MMKFVWMVTRAINLKVFVTYIILACLLISCSKKEQFIFTSDEDGVICSAKSTFNDTIYYENRFPDSTIFYYATLSKYENEELKKSIEDLKTEKSLTKFELHPGSGTFTVVDDGLHFYEANYSIPSHNFKKILLLFREKGPHMKSCKKVDGFWDIDGVTAPDNPVP